MANIRIASPCILIVSCTFMVLSTGDPRAELHVGTVSLPTGMLWDFSDSTIVGSPSGDLYVTIALLKESQLDGKVMGASSYPYFFSTWYPAVIAFAPLDTTYEDLTMAPADTTLYWGIAEIFAGQAYVVRTVEYHYAKLRVLYYSDAVVEFEYTYQDNGTRVLTRTVPVESTTWGRIKNLYRR